MAATSHRVRGGSNARPEWRRFRCPVCGHADRVTASGSTSARVDCPHCSARLEVTFRSALDEGGTARLVQETEH